MFFVAGWTGGTLLTVDYLVSYNSPFGGIDRGGAVRMLSHAGSWCSRVDVQAFLDGDVE